MSMSQTQRIIANKYCALYHLHTQWCSHASARFGVSVSPPLLFQAYPDFSLPHLAVSTHRSSPSALIIPALRHLTADNHPRGWKERCEKPRRQSAAAAAQAVNEGRRLIAHSPAFLSSPPFLPLSVKSGSHSWGFLGGEKKKRKKKETHRSVLNGRF